MVKLLSIISQSMSKAIPIFFLNSSNIGTDIGDIIVDNKFFPVEKNVIKL